MQKKDVDFKKLPDAPGVYLFHAADDTIVYVGKATSLRSRVRSYFGKDLLDTRGPKIVKMVTDAVSLTWEETDSVLEALILEANLIKKHQPEGNTRDKDNKSFNYLVITREEFPQVRIVRGRDLFTKWEDKDMKYLFGPFPQGGALKEALRIVRKIFPFRDKCELDGSLCFNAQLGLCPGVCAGAVSKAAYGKTIQRIKLMFEGRKSDLIQQLEKDMQELARTEHFEDAALVKRKLFALTHIRDTALLGDDFRVSAGDDLGRIEAYDIAHISETARVGVMVVVADGVAQKDEYRKFTIQTDAKGDTAALEEVLRRRFDHPEWEFPKLLVIDGGVAQKNTAQKVLDERGYAIPIVNVVKNERHKVGRIVGNKAILARHENDIVLANSEAHRFAIAFHRAKRRKNLV